MDEPKWEWIKEGVVLVNGAARKEFKRLPAKKQEVARFAAALAGEIEVKEVMLMGLQAFRTGATPNYADAYRRLHDLRGAIADVTGAEARALSTVAVFFEPNIVEAFGKHYDALSRFAVEAADRMLQEAPSG